MDTVMGTASTAVAANAVDRALDLCALALGVPTFWLGILLILLFSVQLGWTPVSGRLSAMYFVEPKTGFLLIDALMSDEKGAFRSALRHLILPTVLLGIAVAIVFLQPTWALGFGLGLAVPALGGIVLSFSLAPDRKSVV